MPPQAVWLEGSQERSGKLTREGKRVYELTDAGRAEATRRVEEAGGPPWSETDVDGGSLRANVMQLMMAARQVGGAGSAEQVEQATKIVTDARKQLYRLLAED